MESHQDAAETKRKIRKRGVITEMLTTERQHQLNLERMIEITRSEEFKSSFDKDGPLLQQLTDLTNKTEALLIKLREKSPWKELRALNDADAQVEIAKLVESYSPSPNKLQQLIRTLPKLAKIQLQCTVLANAFTSNPAIKAEREKQFSIEEIARKKSGHSPRETTTSVTNQFRVGMDPTLFMQRFPRYEMMLKELQKHIGENKLSNSRVETALKSTNKLTNTTNALEGFLNLLQPECRGKLINSLENWGEKSAGNNIREISGILVNIAAYQKQTKLKDNTVMMFALLKPVELLIHAKLSNNKLSDEEFQKGLMGIAPSLQALQIYAEKNPEDTGIMELRAQINASLGKLTTPNFNNDIKSPDGLFPISTDAILSMPLSDIILMTTMDPSAMNNLLSLVGGLVNNEKNMGALSASDNPHVQQLSAFLQCIKNNHQHSSGEKSPPFITDIGTINATLSLRDVLSNIMKSDSNTMGSDSPKPRRSFSGSQLKKKTEGKTVSTVAGLFIDKGVKKEINALDAIKEGAPAIWDSLIQSRTQKHRTPYSSPN